ncbi:probable inactive ATP-dependent zinc metalloprotease FTSHI 5, chloroplastic [Corylus avellana]|uniref:probable inactive ATP-dependent zinc metalloprotease FTSHI 5, chloroplastic n=2 Tax=Corylus avellana TaxID=13451 RepID=UPI00286C0F70|nr:probable inactive ATP-dependent zinc metalloprotease FTSHI 5, chloroplastic [Corylus avellana]
MDAILFSLPPTNPFTYICPPPYRSPSSPLLSTKRRIRIQRTFTKPHKKPTNVFPFGSHSSSISFPQASRSSKFENPGAISAVEASSSSNSEYPEEESLLEDCSSLNSQFPDQKSLNLIVHYANFGSSVLKCIAKPMLYALFCIAVGFSPIRGFRACAIAVPAVAEAIMGRKENVKEGELIRLSSKGHEYSDCTRRLLETVSGLLRSIEEVRRGNGDIKEVEAAWKAVKSKKEELQREIMSELYVQMKELRKEKHGLEQRAEEIVDEVVIAKREYERLVRKGQEEGKQRVERLEENLRGLEEEYNRVWERVGEIGDEIARREFVVMSFAMRELCFIERECEQLVGRFSREMRQKGTDSLPDGSATKLSKSDIQKDLESAQRRHLEQMILPSILESEDLGPLFDRDSVNFAQRIKEGLKDSRELQRNLEARIRKNMRKFGDEKLFVVNTPEDEVLKGFPEVELKWMFGNKEVVVPKAINLHLYHGWKKWREEAKADLKRNLLENDDFGKQYVAQRQEHILLDRDRVVSKTWYDEEKNRWEMDPVAVPYAVSNKLVEHARIRHDWAAMYIALKGDAKEYFVDIKEFEMLFEEFGGFDGLYMKMLACGIPTTVHLTWIPFSELDFRQQFLLTMRLSRQSLNGLWKSKIVSYARDWVLQKIKNINDDIMMMIVFPTVELIIPYPVRMQLGMAWPEEIGQTVGSTWYLKWQSEAEISFKSRKTDDTQWFLWFFIRTIIYGFVLFHVIRFMKRKIPSLLGYGPLRRDPNLWKLRRVKTYLNYRVRRIKDKKKAGFDPIKTAFDGMKRVKNPPIPLKDFASVESMREEMNEVVAFLQNPRAFQEMGARAPRGVLIVGERGTGKTSLALAIAAEAKVPVVKVEAQQLEAGLWVGQSASNVRELFQTARDLAPVIIFVEDFDLFAGVRGKFIHTKNQDHEAFINQLLVELDGFEKQDGVVLMATTRNLKQIDEALQRPGRMDRVFHLQRPTQAEREKILQTAAKQTMDSELIDLVDWGKVAEKTALLRPIELKLVPVALEGGAFRSKFLDTDELMSYCSWFATFSGIVPKWIRKTKFVNIVSKLLVNHLGLTLTKEDVQNVVDLMEPYGQITNGIELLNPPLNWTRETKFPHAVWAAGRGLIALLLPNFDDVDNLWLEPLSWQGIGCTKITKARNEGSMNGNSESRSYLEKKLVFCFGSYIAARMLLPFGEENFLSSSELKQAQEIATRMVIQYGWGPDDSPAIYYHSNAVTALSMGNNHEYEMAAKVEKMYDLAYYKAKEMLQKNRQVLEKIVEELLEFEILTRKDMERMVEDYGGIREKEPFFLSKSCDREPLSSGFLDGGNTTGTALLSAPASA